MRISMRAAILAVALSSASAAVAQGVAAEPLTLQQAIERAVTASPQGAATTARADVLTASRAQADTRPAASIGANVENLGIGGRDLNDQIQLDVTYNQRIERGGKRAARIALVDGDIGVANAEAVVKRLEIAAAVQRLFVEVQATEIAIGNARERVGIAVALQREVQRRVDAARDPLFAGTRARSQLAEARVDLELAEHARDAALVRLTALWGGTPAGIVIATDRFLAFDRAGVATSPAEADLAIYEARRRRADAAIALERSNAVSDPTFSAGPRILGTGDVAVVAGFTMPLRNRSLANANMARAEAERSQIAADLAVERFQRSQAIMLAAERVEESRHEAEAVRDRVIPGAEQTLREVRAGYARGGFSFLDVSTAQLTLAAARTRLVQAATRYHQAGVELDRLTGRFIPLVQEAR
jgi:cobalt-zinc-cadmium efflux system outer membrane protein